MTRLAVQAFVADRWLNGRLAKESPQTVEAVKRCLKCRWWLHADSSGMPPGCGFAFWKWDERTVLGEDVPMLCDESIVFPRASEETQ